MSVRRVMGTETEYAVSRPGDRYANPVRLSFDVVAAADDGTRGDIRWDYRQEDPVNDARGHRLDRAAARPDMPLQPFPGLGDGGCGHHSMLLRMAARAAAARVRSRRGRLSYGMQAPERRFSRMAWASAGLAT